LHPPFDELFSEFLRLGAISSVVERLLHTQEVAGSNPASRTISSANHKLLIFGHLILEKGGDMTVISAM
jgi:hypothetical protein